ncbi:hypothetical protein AVEN_95274-1 [Araneus ventricosus]|uniref:Uncharacterized protein n=1 Tax=Araneus ventricosus TaxID=182803 RepID=A0A4Y2DII4_ARAVE|nr:hypothetical protein AVEN_95274-1 [Araneus ventricosus]
MGGTPFILEPKGLCAVQLPYIVIYRTKKEFSTLHCYCDSDSPPCCLSLPNVCRCGTDSPCVQSHSKISDKYVKAGRMDFVMKCLCGNSTLMRQSVCQLKLSGLSEQQLTAVILCLFSNITFEILDTLWEQFKMNFNFT